MLAVKMCWGISCSHFCLTDTLLSQMKQAVLANTNLSINKSTSVKNVLLSCWEKQWVWMMHRPELFVLIMLCTLLQWPELESKTHNYKQDITVSKHNSQSFILLVLCQMKIMTEWTRKKKGKKCLVDFLVSFCSCPQRTSTSTFMPIDERSSFILYHNCTSQAGIDFGQSFSSFSLFLAFPIQQQSNQIKTFCDGNIVFLLFGMYYFWIHTVFFK